MDAPFASIGFVDDTELRVRSHGGRFDLSEVHVFDPYTFTTRACEQPFDLWLRDRCREIRSTYDDQSWRDMAEAPRPFTASEQAILEARRRFSVRVAPRQEGQGERDVALIVRNESRMTLPQISVLKLGSNYQSIARIDTSQCLPGREHRIPLRAHLGQPECEYELLPDPLPEERDLYWELSSTQTEP